VTTVAVIQPYFIPYAGYFRLFAAADVVVMFDCVQFPRRGWVHRNRLRLASGNLDWLTLPLANAPRDTRIADLRFASDGSERLRTAIRRFPSIESAHRNGHDMVESLLDLTGMDVARYLCDRVCDIAELLGFARPMMRSSSMGIPAHLRAQDRVLAIVKALGGTRYVNPSGGRELYDHSTFATEGIELRFLTPYGGAVESVLGRLLAEPVSQISGEIAAETLLVP
jgi:hypothetical protein